MPVVGAAGPLVAASGYGIFLNAARKVIDAGVDAEFLIAGQGDDEGDLRRRAERLRIADRLTFAEGVTVGLTFWDVLDVYCQTSVAPTVGRPLALAMAAGVPSITTDVEGLRTLVRDGETGLTDPSTATPAALARAIVDLLTDRGRARQLGEAGRGSILGDHHPDREAERLDRLYGSIIAAGLEPRGFGAWSRRIVGYDADPGCSREVGGFGLALSRARPGSLTFQARLIDVGPGQEIVERQQRAEDQAGPAVQEPEPKDVRVAESDDRAHRKAEVDFLQEPLESLARPDRRRDRFPEEPLVHRGLPGRVPVVLLDPDGDRGVGMVVELVRQPEDSASKLDVLVSLVVPRLRAGVDGHPFVSTEPVFEQAEVPCLGIAAVANPPAEEEVLHVQVESVRLIGRRPARDLLRQFGHDHLVGVDDQDPLVAEREALERPVLLLGVGPVEVELDDGGPVFGGDAGRLVGALAVDDDHLVGPLQSGEASPQVLGLVLDGDDDADGDAS